MDEKLLWGWPINKPVESFIDEFHIRKDAEPIFRSAVQDVILHLIERVKLAEEALRATPQAVPVSVPPEVDELRMFLASQRTKDGWPMDLGLKDDLDAISLRLRAYLLTAHPVTPTPDHIPDTSKMVTPTPETVESAIKSLGKARRALKRSSLGSGVAEAIEQIDNALAELGE